MGRTQLQTTILKYLIYASIAACLLLITFCEGKRRGRGEAEVAHINQEIESLEAEKELVDAEAKAGDTTALRHRIIRLGNELGGERPRP